MKERFSCATFIFQVSYFILDFHPTLTPAAMSPGLSGAVL